MSLQDNLTLLRIELQLYITEIPGKILYYTSLKYQHSASKPNSNKTELLL